MIKKYFIVFLFSLHLFTCLAQADIKSPLISILASIEQQHDVHFTYIDKVIDTIKCVSPKSSIALNEKIKYLEEQSPIQFKFIDRYYISVTTLLNKTGNVQELKEITLSNYLSKNVLKDLNGNIIIKPNKFSILPGLTEPDVLQTVQYIPGVMSTNESISNINIRGGTHDQNLILWDGIKMYQSGHFFGLISAYSPYLTNRVLVTKNGTSAAYGDGVSSTIDMQLDDNFNHTILNGIGLNLIHIDGFSKLRLSDKLELQFSIRRAITDYVKTPTYNEYFKRIFEDTDINSDYNSKTVTTNKAFYFYDFASKLLYDITNKDRLRFNFIKMYNNLDYIEDLSIPVKTNTLSSGINQQSLALGLSYKRLWTKTFDSDLKIYASNYSINATNFDLINVQRLFQKNEVIDTGIKLHTNYKIGKTINWSNGYNFYEIGITNIEEVNIPIFFSNIKKVLRHHSIYSEVAFHSNNKKTSLRKGIRFNYFNKFNFFLIEPRLSLNHKINKYFNFEVLAEAKSQTTSQVIQRQNDFLGVEKRRWVLSDNSLRPVIKSKQISLGINYSKNKLLISTEGYLKKVEGITTRNQGFQNQYQFADDIGNYYIKGIDLLVNKRFNRIESWFNYSFSDNNYTFNTLNNEKKFPNNLNIKHYINIASNYVTTNFKLGLSMNWRSGNPVSTPNVSNPIINNTINYNSPNSESLKSYFRTDFSSTYKLKLSNTVKSTIGISIWNILNRKNIVNTYYILNDDNSISKIENKSLRLTPNLSFRLSF